MIKPEQIPDEVAKAAHDVFWNAVYNGQPIDLDVEFDRLFHYAIAATLNAWPRMKIPTQQWARDNGRNIAPCIILPLPQENTE